MKFKYRVVRGLPVRPFFSFFSLRLFISTFLSPVIVQCREGCTRGTGFFLLLPGLNFESFVIEGIVRTAGISEPVSCIEKKETGARLIASMRWLNVFHGVNG